MFKGAIVKFCDKDYGLEYTARYLYIENNNDIYRFIASKLRATGMHYYYSIDNPLSLDASLLNAFEEGDYRVCCKPSSTPPILINRNGGECNLGKYHTVLQLVDFNDIDEFLKWIDSGKWKDEENYFDEYPYLCGILLPNGAFYNCRCREHSETARYLIDTNTVHDNYIILGYNPRYETLSYAEVSGNITEEQKYFLELNKDKLNNAQIQRLKDNGILE